jgi:hypothetical protein
VDALPLTPVGKVDKKQLRLWLVIPSVSFLGYRQSTFCSFFSFFT